MLFSVPGSVPRTYNSTGEAIKLLYGTLPVTVFSDFFFPKSQKDFFHAKRKVSKKPKNEVFAFSGTLVSAHLLVEGNVAHPSISTLVHKRK